MDDPERVAALEHRAAELGLPFFRASGVTGAGVPELLEAMWTRLRAQREADQAEADRVAHEHVEDLHAHAVEK